jgi:hypothetical protein
MVSGAAILADTRNAGIFADVADGQSAAAFLGARAATPQGFRGFAGDNSSGRNLAAPSTM